MSAIPSRVASVDLTELVALAVDGLLPMFDAKAQLFCHRLKDSDAGLIPEGLSHRYTIIALLGLSQCENAGIMCGIDIQAVLSRLLEDIGWIDNIGDLGLMMWLCALAWPERLASLSGNLDFRNPLIRFGEARARRTTELAWLLAGLSHASLASRGRGLRHFPDLAATVYGLLKQNQGDSGIFCHQGRTTTLSGIARGHIGSFADQVYPIYSLAKFSQAYGVPEAAQAAGKCAEAICKFQGRLGQWWWHYNASTGLIAEPYPVYSVHQDGMAPMALFALADQTCFDFTDAVYKGLEWLSGDNEVGCDLRDMDRKVIWRSVRHSSRYGVWRDRIWYSVAARDAVSSRDRMTVLRECRPYHLGWVLYAFAGRGPSLG